MTKLSALLISAILASGALAARLAPNSEYPIFKRTDEILAVLTTTAVIVPIKARSDLDWLNMETKREAEPAIQYVGSKREAGAEPAIQYVGSKREADAEPAIQYVGSKREAAAEPAIQYVGSKREAEAEPAIQYVGSKRAIQYVGSK